MTEKYLGTKFDITDYAQNTTLKDSYGTHSIEKRYWMASGYFSDNILDEERINREIERTRAGLKKELEKLENTTAAKIQKAKQKKQELLKKLNDISSGLDYELLEKADYGRTYYSKY